MENKKKHMGIYGKNTHDVAKEYGFSKTRT
jgi:hypothetical protein